MKLRSYQIFFLPVDRKGIFFNLMRLIKNKAELKHQVQVSLLNMLTCFVITVATRYIRFFLTNTKPHIFRIPKNQGIPNIQFRCLNFSFSIKGLSNLNYFAREGRKKPVNSSIVDYCRNYNKI